MPTPLFKRWVPPTPASKSSPTAVSASKFEPESSPLRPTKKEKKRKREPATETVEDEDMTKKHKSVLSKFEKVSKQLAERRSQQKDDDTDSQNDEPEEELHDLQPMPQPAPVPEPAFEPTFSTLPAWLAQPVNIESSKTTPFAELGVDEYFQRRLEKQGFKDALAVQSALLPLLHQGYEQHLGDICVSAKTGSGKTLAYLLPIVEALKDRLVTQLSAIIVVPSRQLVNQALQVAETLCAGTNIKVGTALGHTTFATEQKQLIKMTSCYNPERAQEMHEKASRQFRGGTFGRGGILDDLLNVLPDHIPQYNFEVDILICTPGRLVEHIERTTGFLLNHLRWLVIDEADQLLSQNFQDWANVLMEALHGEIPTDFMNDRELFFKRERDAHSVWATGLTARPQCTKVILSATMEKDLTKLASLQLKRPKLVVVQDESADTQPLLTEENNFELPSTLDEFAVHVGDGTNKPLHLLHVLLNYVFPGVVRENASDSETSYDDSSDDSSESDSESEFEGSLGTQSNSVLIFTKSNENASRLSHLLSVLQPSFKPYLKTMTRALTAEASKKLLRSFSTGKVKILIASDAVSRGLDIASITHVINYDVPTSITSYVHRVGRTARAGKAGQAWTLFTKSEAAWFLKQVAKGDTIKRGKKKVKRTEWKESTVTANGMKKAYREALAALEGAVKESTE